MHTELSHVLQEAARLAEATADAIKRGDLEKAARLQDSAQSMFAQAKRLGHRQTNRPTLSKVPSMRQRAVSAVLELNVPSSSRLIAAYSEARSGEPFDVRAIASIRRDEYRSWISGSRRETYLVPALEGPWLVAGRGRFGLSHWPLWQRIMGPLSPRADHLKVCLHLAGQVEDERDAEAMKRLRSLLVEYARSVPGALKDAWGKGQDVDPPRVRAAVDIELGLIKEEDEIWRRQEADRAVRRLNDEQQMWGGAAPHLVGGIAS